MSRYFINFTEEIGEVYVKPATDEAVDESFTSHWKLYWNPKRDSYMINYYGRRHKARATGQGVFLFSEKRKEYIAQLENE